MKKIARILLIFSCIWLFSACSNEHQEQPQHRKISRQAVKNELIKTNKHLVKYENQNIKDFISRYHYQMKQTGSGLYYEIYEKGKGVKAEKGKIAQLKYSVRLLNGQLVYDSDHKGIKEFLIGKGGVESGLEEGILLMHQGDKARFIIPSHLAFGLLGDREKIPEKASIVYDIELLNLK